MKEEEIEQWYESEKERLEQELSAALTKDKNNPKAEATFRAGMKELHIRYESRIEQFIQKERKAARKR
ncbi:hypothetical protein KY320_00910 [Candidatus Woesearchaeota archaeon]|nr:hypothetical protein [Candidatus Woesearchaeota archaeon]